MVQVISDKETEELFGITKEQLDQWAEDAENGIFHGEVRKIVRGRPLMFGEETRQVGFKEPVSRIRQIEARAVELGMTRSDYLRHLVDEDLKLAGIA